MFVRFKEAADIAVEIRAAITIVTADRSLKRTVLNVVVQYF